MFKKGQLVYYKSKGCVAIYDAEIDTASLLGTKCYGIQAYQEKDNLFLPTFVQHFEIEEIPTVQLKALLTHNNQTLRKTAKDNLSGREFTTIEVSDEIDIGLVLELFTESYIQKAKNRRNLEETKDKLATLFANMMKQDLQPTQILAGCNAWSCLKQIARESDPLGKSSSTQHFVWGVEFKFEKSLGPWEIEAKSELL